jgi:SAM-dependent methyltransferase
MSHMLEEIKSSPPSLWELEYQEGGIPSSVRRQPSNVVIEFQNFLRTTVPESRTALDIGCGTGRNSFYLAREGFAVTAIDYVQAQVDQIAHNIEGLNIRPICCDIAEPWPFEANSFDVAIDCFCFKHLIHGAAVANYVKELSRTMRCGGYYLLFLAAKEDGYYMQYPVREQSGRGTVIIDPENRIASRLYDIDEIKTLFREHELVFTATKHGENIMHRKKYERSSHVLYLRKS